MIFSSMISRSSCGTVSASDRSVDMISNMKFFTFLLCSSLKDFIHIYWNCFVKSCDTRSIKLREKKEGRKMEKKERGKEKEETQ